LDVVRRHALRIQREEMNLGGSDLDSLLQVGTRLAEFLGWLYQDLGDHKAAIYWSDRAMDWSQQTGDDLMRSYILFRKSNHATAQRNPNQAIKFARAAQRVRGITPRVEALAMQQEAQAHALLGNHKFAMTMFDAAHELVSTPDEPDPASALDTSYCTPNYIEIQRANCLMELGQPGTAAVLFQSELNTLPAVYRNDQGVYLGRLARAYAIGDEPERAAQAAAQALRIACDTESARAFDDLAAAERAMEPWSDVADVVTFRTQFRQVRDRNAPRLPEARYEKLGSWTTP
jgi:tetratricopeptide (TPR) repeat protein